MTNRPVVSLTTAIFVCEDFVAFDVVHDLSGDAGSLKVARLKALACTDCENVFEFDP